MAGVALEGDDLIDHTEVTQTGSKAKKIGEHHRDADNRRITKETDGHQLLVGHPRTVTMAECENFVRRRITA